MSKRADLSNESPLLRGTYRSVTELSQRLTVRFGDRVSFAPHKGHSIEFLECKPFETKPLRPVLVAHES
jgi:hypothetical protein